jgi:glycogen debranching enzyme
VPAALALTRLAVDGKRRLVTYKEWDGLIQASFERCFYIPEG